MDLLARIHQSEISLKEAEDIIDETIDRIHRGEERPGWWATLGLSCYEAIAYAQGADLAGLVQLR